MSKIDSALPAMVDDDGTGRTGTRENVAFFEAWRDAINAQTYSSANPTITPEDIIDEVVTARGSQAALDTRISLEHNADGTHKSTGTLATYITESQLMGGLGGVNLASNDDFLLWPDGDASAPLYWNLTGAGATIARAGTGLGDTTRKIGDFCAAVTRVGADCNVAHIMLQSTAFTRADFMKQKYLSAGMWVKCSTPNIARVGLSDNVGSTFSSYHTGGGAWEFLTVTRQINSSATAIIIFGHVANSNGTAYFSGATCLLVDSSTLDCVQYQPSPVQYGTMHFALSGAVSAATNVGRVRMKRGGIVKDVQALIKTAPTGQAMIFDLNTWDGAAYTSMFSTRPEIADGAYVGGAQPDTTYARRCLRQSSGATRSAGSEMTLDVDQIGSGVAGSDAVIEVGVLQYASPLERFQSY